MIDPLRWPFGPSLRLTLSQSLAAAADDPKRTKKSKTDRCSDRLTAVGFYTDSVLINDQCITVLSRKGVETS